MGKATIPPPPPDPLLWKTRIRDLERELDLPTVPGIEDLDDDGAFALPPRRPPDEDRVLVDVFTVGAVVGAAGIAAAAWWLVDAFFPLAPGAFLGGAGF